MPKIAVMFNGNTYQIGNYQFKVNQPLVVDDATFEYLQKGHYQHFMCWEQASDIVTPEILAKHGIVLPEAPKGDISTDTMAAGGLIAKDSSYERQLQEEVAQREAEIERRLAAQAAAKTRAEAGVLPSNSVVFEDASATVDLVDTAPAPVQEAVEEEAVEEEATEEEAPEARVGKHSNKPLAVKPRIQRK